MHHDAQRRKSKARQSFTWRGDGIESHGIVGNAVISKVTALQPIDGKAKDKRGADSLRVPREAMKWHCN